MARVRRNVWINGRWYGPSYPDAGVPAGLRADLIDGTAPASSSPPSPAPEPVEQPPVEAQAPPVLDPGQPSADQASAPVVSGHELSAEAKAGSEITEPVRSHAPSGPPPRSGKGSGRTEWARYAAQHNVPVTEDMDRGDIITALARADVATDD